MTKISHMKYTTKSEENYREDAIYPTCIRNEKHFKGQLNVLVSFNRRDKPWQWMPLKSLKYGQQLLRNFRTYKARQKRKQENSNLTSNEMNNIDQVWGNEMMADQEIIKSNVGTKDDEDRVKDVDKNFYSNSSEPKVGDMNIDKDFWSENVKMSNFENGGNEKLTANGANNERLILDVMIPLYEKILKIVENENIDMNSIISLCGNGKIDFYQDQKLNGDCGKSMEHFCDEGYREWNNLNMNFEHAETDGAHSSNNDTNNNGFYFPKYHEINHYNETNDKSRLKENYMDVSEPQNYTTSWYAKNTNKKSITYTDVIEECSNGISVPFNDPPAIQVPIKINDFQCFDVKENTSGFWSVGDSVLTFNTWAPWKDKDEFDYELDKLLEKYKAEDNNSRIDFCIKARSSDLSLQT
ncbi:17034_t:CDS:2 [Cetraspora pellucida]|uniref:17034_t:CDS:1 n=1 Tax=Cetraspora pellucida TaxID=1433469 RepID=A0ACA9K375_9GLOM|nr:17034_t:CDS:2 [Cetraspora pellucida]